MPMPYTREALDMIRHAARGGYSRAELRDALGWDDATIDRRCHDHGIDYPGRGNAYFATRVDVHRPVEQPSIVPDRPREPPPPPPAPCPPHREHHPQSPAARVLWPPPKRRERQVPRGYRTITMTFALTEELAAKFDAEVKRQNMSRSAVASQILTLVVERRAFPFCKPVEGQRSAARSTNVTSEVFDALSQEIGIHGSLSALCAAIFAQHFGQSP